ncbi:hypothetical protein O3P69_019398 [Scylla paramamosain]|uniref:Telomere-length maintenance and DNA damage repair domain-containing protein n=1 Tax=Scylla paramamosain TaxID=85552 RepID=A0AAW0SX73_SCYPA
MALEGVKQCCLALKSERVTDRKNGSEKLRSLLNNSAITANLNARPADSFNWSQVFLSARKYFLMEARKLEDEERSKPLVSQTVLRNRETHKRTAASLPLLILKKACRGTPHIHPQLLIGLVLKVLNKREPYLLENFAGEFLLIALKFLLRFQYFYAEMTTANWKDLLKISIWLYEKNINNADPQSVFGVMAGVVERCQTRVVPQRGATTTLEILRCLPAFLRKALLSERLATQFSLRSSLLRLLLAFASAMACEWRQAVSALGEETFDVVLGMWDDRPSAKQTHWLQYMLLLVTLHHPQKDGEVREGSQYSADTTRWERCLRHLYQLLYDHLARLGSRGLADTGGNGGGGGGGGGGSEVLSQPLLSLAARVCLQVFAGSETTGFIDVTQITSTASANKRRKIEVGLTPLTELLKKEGTLPHTLSWYQILLTLLTDHPKFFTDARCLILLQALKQVLAACSDKAVQDVVMRCLSHLAAQHSRVAASRGEAEAHDGSNLWLSVWDLTLRIVSGRHGNSSGLYLMGTLVWTGLCTPDSTAFMLFHKNYLGVNEEALWTLHFQNELSWMQKMEENEARDGLIFFALSVPEEGVGGGSKSVFQNLADPTLLAKGAVVPVFEGTLCCEDTPPPQPPSPPPPLSPPPPSSSETLNPSGGALPPLHLHL